jgi:CRP-like cAMP-binding protein
MEARQMIWMGISVHRATYAPGVRIFAQGDPSSSVLYIEHGSVRLSVVSHDGKEVIFGIIERGHFFGEGCLAGQPLRMSSAIALTTAAIVEIPQDEFSRRLRARPEMAQLFLGHMLTRNARMEEDLVDQLFNDAEKRLARKLLLMARLGTENGPHRGFPAVSQTVLAEMIGTTRSRVNTIMNKFRKLGFIDYNGGGIKVHPSLTVLLSEGGHAPSAASTGRGDVMRSDHWASDRRADAGPGSIDHNRQSVRPSANPARIGP